MKITDSITRRRFLEVAGTTAAALNAAKLLSGHEFASLGAEGSMPPVAVFGKIFQELKLDFEQSAQTTAEASLDGVDCAVRPKGEILPEQAAEQLPRYADVLAKYKLRLLLMTTDIHGVDSPHAREILNTGKKLGARDYRLGNWLHQPEVPAKKLCAEIRSRLKELAAMNGELGVCALVQNHSSWAGKGRGPAGGDLDELYDLVKDFDPQRIAVAFDLGHAIIAHGDAWRGRFEKLRPHIRVVYVKDVQRPDRFVPFGQGEFGQSGFFPMLAKMNYRAPLSLHVEYEWAPQGKKIRSALAAVLKENRNVLGQWWKGAKT
ncbi:MAG: sugar phosphate isomerase/epimerase family protein, partial [Thermoguttaceae bacterium]